MQGLSSRETFATVGWNALKATSVIFSPHNGCDRFMKMRCSQEGSNLSGPFVFVTTGDGVLSRLLYVWAK
jgi:hypothetical protein